MNELQEPINALACTLCKSRKVRTTLMKARGSRICPICGWDETIRRLLLAMVRCDRRMPTCGRCTTQQAECKYPMRQKKKSNKTSKDKAAEISALFDRLQRVEQCVTSQNAQALLSVRGTAGVSSPQTRSQPSPHIPTPSSTVGVGSSRALDSLSPWDDGLPNNDGYDVHTILKDAVERIQRSKLRNTFHAAKSTESIHIPTDLAKMWVQNYFVSMPMNMTTILEENRKLLEMVPDLIDQPNVHIEPAIVVIFYILLYHGCCLPSATAMGLPDPNSYAFIQQNYIMALRSLPAWQRGATGSLLDLTAAIMMTRAAAECYDNELGYKMHKLACEYAEGLGLHRLDSETGASSPSLARTDVERRRFWDMIQYDIYFRLMLNKPFGMTTPMEEWRVNLPYLDSPPELGSNTEPAIMFLFCSRVTFEIAGFFKLLDGLENEDKRSLLPQVEVICRNCQALYHEWQIDEVLQNTSITQVNGWLIADAAIAGLMSIILMLRAIDATDSSLIIEPSRHVLRVVDSMLTQVPTLGIMALSFFSLMAFMPYALVAGHVLQHADRADELSEDIALLERLKTAVGLICRDESDFVPLQRAMEHTCNEIQMRIHGGPSHFDASMDAQMYLQELAATRDKLFAGGGFPA